MMVQWCVLATIIYVMGLYVVLRACLDLLPRKHSLVLNLFLWLWSLLIASLWPVMLVLAILASWGKDEDEWPQLLNWDDVGPEDLQDPDKTCRK